MNDVAAISSALTALLGGTFFRLGLGFAMDRLKDWQEYRFELGRMRLQEELEESNSKRQLRLLEAQKELGLQTVEVERDNASMDFNMEQFRQARDELRRPTGFKALDAWNSAIRPALATFCIIVWGIYLGQRGWVLGPWDLELIAATLGLFIGSRISSTGK